jgi:hypothetical protein
MVTDDPIRHPVLHHVLRDIARPAAAIHEPRDEIPSPIEFRHGLQLILIEKALHETAVDRLADPTVLSIN